MAKGYTTKTKVEDFLNTTVSLSDDKFDNFITAVEKYIDQLTERNFIATAEEYRYYDGNGKQTLIIDDCTEVTEVNVGTNFWGDSHITIDTSGTDRYYTIPKNHVQEGVPIMGLVLRSRNWIRGFGNHEIKAKWGYSAECPEDISWISTFLVASIYKKGQGGGIGGIKSESIGEYDISFQTEKDLQDFNRAKEILNRYKKYYL